jgi:hypothetical protein
MPELPIIEARDQAALRDWLQANSGKTLQD